MFLILFLTTAITRLLPQRISGPLTSRLTCQLLHLVGLSNTVTYVTRNRAELRRIFQNFYNPSTENSYVVIKRSEPNTTHPGIYYALGKLGRTFNVFQINYAKPHSFRDYLPDEDFIFSRKLSMDIMSLDSQSVHHVFEKYTKLVA